MSYQTLISVDALHALPPAERVLFDCRFDLAKPAWGENAYREAHLPGARYAHLDRDLAAPITATSGRHPLPSREDFARRVGAWGVGPQTQVVVYDQGNGMYAARLWWMLRWIGHRDVALLDGGLAAWNAAGLPLESQLPPPAAAREHPLGAPLGGTIDVAAVQRDLASGAILLVDGRGADRFAGQNETIDPVAGHVPGALNHPFARNLDERGRFLSPQLLRERWQATLQGRPPGEVVAMCGSGVSACHNLLALAHAGIVGTRLYAGSWSEWIRDPARPVANGGS